MKRYFVVLFAVCAFTPEAFAGNAGRPSLAVAGGEGGGQLPGGISKGIGIAKKANDAVYTRVLSFAGARPTDRDSVDRRIVASVQNRTGRIINCVAPDGTPRCEKNAGGWPTMAQNRRTLTLPANHASIASNGYSNLENWLHQLDLAIAGVMPPASTGSPAMLSAQ